MYKVQIEHQCGCFKKSEYESEQSFDKQQDAYNYSKILGELMNEEFCQKHYFFVERSGETDFVVRVVDNPNGSSCSTSGSSCGTSCGC